MLSTPTACGRLANCESSFDADRAPCGHARQLAIAALPTLTPSWGPWPLPLPPPRRKSLCLTLELAAFPQGLTFQSWCGCWSLVQPCSGQHLCLRYN